MFSAALCYVLSLSQLGAPHPAARMPVLDPGIDIGPYANVADVLQISGDLLAWTVFGEATELVLWNWKMGKRVEGWIGYAWTFFWVVVVSQWMGTYDSLCL